MMVLTAEQLTIEPTAEARPLLLALAAPGFYIQIDKRPFVRCIHQPSYKRLVSAAVIAWCLKRDYLAPDDPDALDALLWITDAGRKAVSDDYT